MADSESDKKVPTDQNNKSGGLCKPGKDCRSRLKSATKDCKCISRQQRQSAETPELRMDCATYKSILLTISSRQPETGGILLGPIGSDNEITAWFFDRGLNCTAATYSPDHITLSRKMKEEWMPSGIDMKGFVHSHPGHYDRLSAGDLVYVNRLLDKNEDMSMFAAPIVIPTQFRIRPIVVLREKPRRAQEAKLILF